MAVRKIGTSWWTDFSVDHRRYRKRSPDNSRAGAEEYEVVIRQKLARGEPIDKTEGRLPGDIRFAEFAWKWFEEYAVPNNKFSEQRIKRYTLQSALIPFFGKMLVCEIRTHHIEQYKARKVKEGLASKSIKNHLTVLSKCLACAYKWFEFPSKPPEIPWPKCPPPQTDYLSADECELLLSRAQGAIRELILMALRTGMRQGELKGLQWSDIDWENRVIIVRHSYCDRERTIGPPKNNRIRTIPLDVDLYDMLYRKREKTGYVFTSANGQPLNHSWLSYHLDMVCKQASLRRVTWHVLRHTFASQLAMKGVPLNAVQTLLGHSTIVMTMRYAHVAPSMLRAAIEMLNPRTLINLDSRQPGVNAWMEKQTQLEVSEHPLPKCA